VAVVDPRGVGKLRPPLQVKGHDYADPLVGVEENIAYNAFLVGKSLLGMRVADVLAALARVKETMKPGRVILCGRRDAALVACLAAAVSKDVEAVAVEDMALSFLPLFDAAGQAVNAASILPRLLAAFRDLPDVLAALAPRRVLAAALPGKADVHLANVYVTERSFAKEPPVLLSWLRG
jgi:hypothetical protein